MHRKVKRISSPYHAVIDVETVQGDDGLCEVGIVKFHWVTGREISRFRFIVNSDKQDFFGLIPASTLRVAPSPSMVVQFVEQLLEDCEKIWHFSGPNQVFDHRVLDKTCQGELGRPFSIPENRFRNIRDLAEELYPSERKLNVDVLIEREKLEVKKRHRALSDALAEKRLLLRLRSRMQELSKTTSRGR